MKYVAVANKNGQTSGVKGTREEAEAWARNQFDVSKSTEVIVFKAISKFEVAPREIIETTIIEDISFIDKRNGHGAPVCEECPKPNYADGSM